MKTLKLLLAIFIMSFMISAIQGYKEELLKIAQAENEIKVKPFTIKELNYRIDQSENWKRESALTNRK